MAHSRRMIFDRYGRSFHLRIRNADDLAHILELDESHWLATGAPIDAMNTDASFLEFLDEDNNGRILCFEVKNSVKWLLETLSDHSGINAQSTVLRLGAIDQATRDGSSIKIAAQKILSQLGTSEATEVTLKQVREIKAKVEGTPLSSAGVVLPEASGDETIKQFIANIVAVTGGTDHPSGSKGVTKEQLDTFLKQATEHIAWQEQGIIPAGETKTAIMPLGTQTDEAYAAYIGIREKVDQYFAQCTALSFDSRVSSHLGPGEEDIKAVDLLDPLAIDDLLKGSPLATARDDITLDFKEHVNPHYQDALNLFSESVVKPIIGHPVERLPIVEWHTIKSFFADHEKWHNARISDALDKLGPELLASYAEPKYAAAIEEFIQQSTKTAFVLDNIRLTEKLLLFQTFMLPLANNFVSFPYLYDPLTRAIFERGTLIIDGRHLTFSVAAANRAQHSAIAKESSIFVIYAEITPAGEGPKHEVAVAVTSGGKGNLCVGKRGLFIDVNGRGADAKVVQIIENPISVAEALAAPFRRIGKLMSGKIESLTSAAEKRLDTKTAQTMNQPQQSATQPNKSLMAGGMLMGGSVAVAALGSAMAYITKTLSSVAPATIAIGVLIAILAVIMPASVIALLKLRRRDLSSILEGSGWAINERMRLTQKQGRLFTHQPEFPKGSKRARRTWSYIVLIIIILTEVAVISRVWPHLMHG